MPTINKNSSIQQTVKEDLSLFINKPNYNFFFIIKPRKVLHSFLGLSLSFIARFLAIIYAFRSFQGIAQYFNSSINQSILNLALNAISIITFFLLYMSIYLKNCTAAVWVYYSYFLHFIIKLLMSCNLLIQRIMIGKYLFNVIVGAGIGLFVGSFINLMSAWIMFSFMVYSYNVEEQNHIKP